MNSSGAGIEYTMKAKAAVSTSPMMKRNIFLRALPLSGAAVIEFGEEGQHLLEESWVQAEESLAAGGRGGGGGSLRVLLGLAQ